MRKQTMLKCLAGVAGALVIGMLLYQAAFVREFLAANASLLGGASVP